MGTRAGGGSRGEGERRKMRLEMKGNKFPRPDQEFGGGVGAGERGLVGVGVGGMVLSCAPRLNDDISA